MKVNGEIFEFREGMTVSNLIAEMGFSEAMVAVELNLDILPRDSFSSTVHLGCISSCGFYFIAK